MKKFLAALLALTVCAGCFAACQTTPPPVPEEKEEKPVDWLEADALLKDNFSAGGYVTGKIGDFTQYENSAAYRKVTTPDELLTAIADAKCHYTNVWDDATSTYTQVPADGYTQETMTGSVRVIEIANDLDMGYYKLSDEAKKNTSVVEDFCRRNASQIEVFTMSNWFLESGVSQIKVENTSDLLIFSKNGAKITHAGFKLTSDDNVVFRNLSFDELWQWEDAKSPYVSKVGDYDAFGWAYFKIAFCGYVWIDHCSFGKSYDGQIDYSNPVYNASGSTAFRAPLGADGGNGLHISWCDFHAGSDDENGYLYKMMKQIEDEYQAGGTKYLYYNALRDYGVKFEEILYGLAIPQKKGFLCGDKAKFSGSYDNLDDYNFNLKLRVSFANCKFTGLEDRLPKVRGGNIYMYGCVVDNSNYYKYRTRLREIEASTAITEVSSGWKCALVSQGIVCGNGGSVKAENCVFKGIDALLKNNDDYHIPYSFGGYELVNCLYQKEEDGVVYKGSSSDEGNLFSNANTSSLSTEYFKWNTADGNQPFTPKAFAIETLSFYLNNATYGVGAGKEITDRLLKSAY